MKYIDAERLKSKIERLKGQLIRGACAAQIEMETNCKDEAYNEVLALIDSLQQDQPEVALEKFISDFIDKKDSENQGKWCEEDIIEAMKSSFALGLNARKEE